MLLQSEGKGWRRSLQRQRLRSTHGSTLIPAFVAFYAAVHPRNATEQRFRLTARCHRPAHPSSAAALLTMPVELRGTFSVALQPGGNTICHSGGVEQRKLTGRGQAGRYDTNTALPLILSYPYTTSVSSQRQQSLTCSTIASHSASVVRFW